MATYRTEIDSPKRPGDVFEYLATFSNEIGRASCRERVCLAV